jgi:hypothetical protein
MDSIRDLKIQVHGDRKLLDQSIQLNIRTVGSEVHYGLTSLEQRRMRSEIIHIFKIEKGKNKGNSFVSPK